MSEPSIVQPEFLGTHCETLPLLEDVAPRDILEELLRDCFEFIHPLAAVLHQDSVFQQLNASDSHDADFVALSHRCAQRL